MAIGDDATAAGMDLVPGSTLANTIDTELNKTRDYIAQRTATVAPIAKGGTAATTAAAALTSLGAVPASDVVLSDGSVSIGSKIPRYTPGGGLIAALPTTGNGVATKNYADGKVDKGGDTMTGDLKIPGATAAVTSYTVCYINGGDGRISKGASSRRFKKAIKRILPSKLGDLFPQLSEFEMRGGDGHRYVGYIAEDLHDSDTMRRFVVYDTEQQVESIDFIGLLLAQVAQLHERVTQLEAQ